MVYGETYGKDGMRERNLFKIDILILLTALVLITLGIIFIYSSGVSSTGILVNREYLKQLLWAITGIIILTVILYINLSFLENWAGYIYGTFILLLGVTLLFGKTVNGAKSWLGFLDIGLGIQPSEFMKIAAIILLAKYYQNNLEEIRTFKAFLISLGIILLPCFLILLQPDLGTAMVLLPVFIFVAYTAGVKKRYLLFLVLVGLGTSVLSILPAWQKYILEKDFPIINILTDRNTVFFILIALTIIALISLFGLISLKRRYFYWIIYYSSTLFVSFLASFGVRSFLKDYQIKRLIIFMDPTIDPRGAGWHIMQSLTAIGSGGFGGKGFLQGTQSHYRYLPQQSTDFIFSILSEEWGFLGGVAVFLLYAIMIFRGLKIIKSTKNLFALYLGAGILTVYFFHFTVNIGMVMGLLPITGIPLYFVSYGGSALWTAVIGIGLLLNIYKERFNF